MPLSSFNGCLIHLATAERKNRNQIIGRIELPKMKCSIAAAHVWGSEVKKMNAGEYTSDPS